MIRIIGVQRSSNPDREFVLLQNQGPRRLPLAGYMLTDDLGLGSRDSFVRGERIYYFCDDVKLIPSAYVALVTGRGDDGWRKTQDFSVLYQLHWGRDRAVWYDSESPLHLLNIVNTHAAHPEGYLVRR